MSPKMYSDESSATLTCVNENGDVYIVEKEQTKLQPNGHRKIKKSGAKNNSEYLNI